MTAAAKEPTQTQATEDAHQAAAADDAAASMPPSDDNGGTASSPTRRARGTGTTPKVTYHIYAGAEARFEISTWVVAQDLDLVIDGQEVKLDELNRLVESMDEHIGSNSDDLLYLATESATDRDQAVGQMLASSGLTASDRLRLVQLAHRAQVNLDFPTVPVSYLKDVPVHWEVKPTFSIGGKR
jgi:hypothetical protein